MPWRLLFGSNPLCWASICFLCDSECLYRHYCSEVLEILIVIILGEKVESGGNASKIGGKLGEDCKIRGEFPKIS